MRTREVRTAALVFLVALLVRLLYLHEIAGSPTFANPLVDAQTYDRLARGLASGGGLTDEFFWQPFFYPTFLAAAYRVTEVSLWWTRVFQMVLGAATCALTCHLGNRLLGRNAGLVAGLITAFYGPSIFEDGELLATGWASLWSVVLLLLLAAAARRPRLDLCLVLGLCSALATLTRPNFLPFAVAGTVWLGFTWIRERRDPGRIVSGMAAALFGFLLVSLPVARLAAVVTGRASFLPASGGINLYIGNHPRSSELVAIRPGWEWQRLTLLPRFHGVEHKQDTSRFFAEQVRQYAVSQPAAFLRGIALKTLQMISSRELPRNLDIYVFRERSATLRLLVWKVGWFGFPFGALLPLALVGLVCHGRSLGAPIWLFLALYGGSIVLVFVTGRYRVPLVPALAVAAAGGGLALARIVRERSGPALALAVAGMATAVLLGGLPGPFPQETADYRAELSYLLGRRKADEGDSAAARQLLEQALERQPDHSDAHNALGFLLLGQGLLEPAHREFERTLTIDPDHSIARGNLARVLARQGDPAGAVEQFRRALAVNPWDVDQLRDLGRLLLRLGDDREAGERLAEALRLDPQHADTRYFLGRALLPQGRTSEALEQLEAAVALDGLHAEALDALVSLLVEIGRKEDAVAHCRRALERARAADARKLAAHIEERLRSLSGGG